MTPRLLLATCFVFLAACGSASTPDSGTPDAGIPVSCSPLGTACAQANKYCYPVVDGTQALCLAAGTTATGLACTTIMGNPAECIPGDICLNVGSSTASSHQCVQYCNTDGGAPTCGTGACQPASGATFGVCL